MEQIFHVKNKVALITGSSRGLGFVMAKGLGRAGAKVILNGRGLEALNNAVDQLTDEGIKASGYAFDITNENKVKEVINKIHQDIGDIGILVNNAGIQKRAPLAEFDYEDWKKVIDINLSGSFLVSKYVIPGMIRTHSGKIINICSLQSELGRETIAPYAAAKGGLKMLTKAMATEWAKYNIQVNGIGPGYFITEMTRSLSEDKIFDEWLKNRTPARRWGNPEELVGTLIYLASNASNFINGQVIYVDGGILATI